jgi:AbrB family looped-hinge helix DNA binding protein
MLTLATTKMSSKGQIVIPEVVRDQMGLKAGAQFVVVGEDDVIILKTITVPSMKEFDTIIKIARQRAKAARMKKSDIAAAVAEVRERK